MLLITRTLLLLCSAAVFSQSSWSLGVPVAIKDSQTVILNLPKTFNNLGHKSGADKVFANPQERLEQVFHYLDLLEKTGDQRYLGYAETLLDAASVNASTDLLMAKAVVFQKQHRFEDALALLEEVIARNPRSGNAYWQTANINFAMGNPDAAAKACGGITLLLSPVIGGTCMARVSANSGQLELAHQQLLKLSPSANSDLEKIDINLSLATVYQQMGDDTKAAGHLQQVLSIEPTQRLAIKQLSDIYLKTGQYRSCWQLLSEKIETPELLLRRTLAARELQLKQFKTLKTRLEQIYREQIQRDPHFVSRDYARYLLEIKAQPKRAFNVALSNWKQQKEPEDTLMTLQTASAAGANNSQIKDILSWITQHELQDARIPDKFLL